MSIKSVFFLLDSTSNTGIKIQFFGAKQDGNRVRDAFYKMVDRGRMGNVTLIPSSLAFREEAVLQIEVCIKKSLVKFKQIDQSNRKTYQTKSMHCYTVCCQCIFRSRVNKFH